jgi:hypothetical protein
LTIGELRIQLAEALAALHALQTGKQVVEVSREGRKVVYSRADAGDLRTYIESLKAQIIALDPTGTESLAPRRRAIGVRF